MKKTMTLELHFVGGGELIKDLTYYGDSLEEIAKHIENDENELLYYMQTLDTKDVMSFCFSGFIFQKESIMTAQLSEPKI